MAEQSPRDQNFIPAALFESSTQPGVVQAGQINTSTGRVKVDMAGGGSVTSVSVVSANGFAGSVATSTTTPAITLSTTVNSPVLAGNGTAIAAATTTGSGSTVALATSPIFTTPNLGTPSTLVATNATGTASGLTAGTVTTNANLTGAVTSVGNATSLGSFSSANLSTALTDETGSGAAVFGTNPTIAKPVMNARNQTAQTYIPAGAGTATLDLALADQHYITMPAGNITIALSNDTNNQIFYISITQDGGGSRTVTWFTTIRWAGGVAPTLTTTGSKRDTFIFVRTGSGTYDGFVVGQNI